MAQVATIEQPLIQVVTMGERGQRGIAGPPGSAAQPQISAENTDSVAVFRGQPLHMQPNGSVVRGNAVTSGRVVGFVSDPVIPPTTFGLVQTDGQLDATLAEWQVVTGSAGGLSPGARYFLSTTPGMLTLTPDLMNIVAFVGRAASPTTMIIDIDPPVFP